MSDLILDATDETFDALLDSRKPLVVDFWATWCQPCLQIAPWLERFAAEYEGRVRVAKVDVDRCPRAASELQVRAVPTFMIAHRGEIVEIQSGGDPHSLKALFEQAAALGKLPQTR
jgi:thioredoxin